MKDFEQYLRARYRPSTVKHYLWEISRFSRWTKPETATQKEILSYIHSFRETGKKADYLKSILAALKAWYQYLVDTHQRADHPCKYLQLKDKQAQEVMFQDLFSLAELEKLLKRKDRYPLLAMRNQLIIGLLIYQGLTVGELCKLRPQDLDLEKGEVHIPATTRTHSRTLSLQPIQILPAHLYIHRDRDKLLQGNEHPQLIITKKGTAESGPGILYLILSGKKRWERRKLNPQTIRMSVIARWLKEGKNLREVQYMAGHKKASSTERYKQTDVEELRALISRFHPH